MPLFIDSRGEGVFVEPAPHRVKHRKLSKAQRRAVTFMVWARYEDEGLSPRSIAILVEKPYSTVRDGIATHRASVAASDFDRKSGAATD